MNIQQQIYDEICAVLTDYEGNGATAGAAADDLYRVLVKIQNCWVDILTVDLQEVFSNEDTD